METAFMTLQEVAEYICFQPNTVYRKARKGDIPCHKIGRVLRFKKEEIDQWVKQQAEKQKGSAATDVISQEGVEDLLSLCGIGKSGKGDLAEKHNQYLYLQ